jgi:hypothetical protein
MEFVFEVVLQFLGEILIQIVFEAFSELGFHSLADTFKRPKSAFLSTIGFVLWGTIAGGLSLLIMPKSFISNLGLREANVLITPLVVGGAMTLIGRLRDKRGQDRVGVDRFGYAFVFALSMAIVRFNWAG